MCFLSQILVERYSPQTIHTGYDKIKVHSPTVQQTLPAQKLKVKIHAIFHLVEDVRKKSVQVGILIQESISEGALVTWISQKLASRDHGIWQQLRC